VSITLPSGITTIGHNVFNGCSSLASITLPSTITTIGDYGFYGCSSLATITLPSGITTIGQAAFYGCSSLTSIYLPENLHSISCNAFHGCVKLRAIKASSFATTTLNNTTDRGFKDVLINAGFSTSNPCDIISDHQTYGNRLYYDWKRWARTRGDDGRLPLFTAATKEVMQWSKMKRIFTSNMPAVNEIDVVTGLPLFLFAATGPFSDIESVYNLLKEVPAAMNIINNRLDTSSTERTRKRGE